MKRKLDRNYVSEHDAFISEMRKKIPETANQIQERNKHKKIFDQRDRVIPPIEKEIL